MTSLSTTPSTGNPKLQYLSKRIPVWPTVTNMNMAQSKDKPRMHNGTSKLAFVFFTVPSLLVSALHQVYWPPPQHASGAARGGLLSQCSLLNKACPARCCTRCHQTSHFVRRLRRVLRSCCKLCTLRSAEVTFARRLSITSVAFWSFFSKAIFASSSCLFAYFNLWFSRSNWFFRCTSIFFCFSISLVALRTAAQTYGRAAACLLSLLASARCRCRLTFCFSKYLTYSGVPFAGGAMVASSGTEVE